jgi:undecaprenyl-phosphate 4-deoxy-4-formamido-L-arabinose transferase
MISLLRFFEVLIILIGSQFVAMGLLGKYIGRIYHDVSGRPRYFVQQIVRRGGIATTRSKIVPARDG